MTSNSASSATTPIHARAIALDDGSEQIVIVVVDSCMLSRPFTDEVKAMAAKKTGIRTDRILISATHAHSVPAAMGCLGTDADANYVPFLRIRLTEAIEKAITNLEPAQVGWAVRNAANYTAVRHWIRRPDRIAEDPFGNKTVRANMHAGRVWEDVTGEAGPEDPDLSMIAFQSKAGRPIALLANFSMHYFGDKSVGADYFGRFCTGVQATLATKSNNDQPPFVAIMSHGCSGDIWRKDYTKQTPPEFDMIDIDTYTRGLVDLAMQAHQTIQYDANATLAMSEARLKLQYRVPDQQRLEWAKTIVERLGAQLPKTQPEIYAREQVMLHERQETDVVVQALRIGSIAITTTPTETYALTGLKLKLQSPLRQTMVIELANGGDGYIPPPEQHVLGGYNTWAARSAGLEVEAEPRIVEACLELLERVCGSARKRPIQSQGPEVAKVLRQKPAAYWRMDETAGPRALDSSGNQIDGFYEPGVVFFLEGPDFGKFCNQGEVNRAAHLAGGRMRARVDRLGDHYSVSLWIWNGMPLDARDVAGWMLGRGWNHALEPSGDALGMVGKGEHAGKIIFQSGKRQPVVGKTAIPRWTWAKVTLVRDGSWVRVYLNDNPTAEIESESPFDLPMDFDEIFVGGRGSRDSSWEGRIDEVAIFRTAINVP
ncbi:MAG: LamG-like jellyroll fold domain-containing protein [Pirellula sp.]